jgi:hypothetical protein
VDSSETVCSIVIFSSFDHLLPAGKLFVQERGELLRRVGVRLRGVEYRPLNEKSPPVTTALAWRRGDESPVVAAFRKTAAGVAAPVGKESK